MSTIGAFEAKTHFSQLLVQVQHGETIFITKHGELVAKLVPIQAEGAGEKRAVSAVCAIRKMRVGVRLGKATNLTALRQVGRK